jgi:putative RNA 2'-phosphotransferase
MVKDCAAKDLAVKFKFLSFVLGNAPACVGLALDDLGWASVEELLAKCAALGCQIDRATLEQLAQMGGKRRLMLSEDGTRIRVLRGTLADDLAMVAEQPPETLYHGTALRFVATHLAEGLRPGRRRHVHLLADAGAARRLGQRSGKPVVLQVAAGAMHLAGHAFYRADSGEWLTQLVPPQFVRE